MALKAMRMDTQERLNLSLMWQTKATNWSCEMFGREAVKRLQPLDSCHVTLDGADRKMVDHHPLPEYL
jgi:hypothetical protein